MNAPKSVTFFTVPSILSPTLILANSSFCFSARSATRSCLLSPITRFLLGLNSLITNSISCPWYLLRSFSYVSETRLAGMNTLASSTTTLNPPPRIWVTGAFNTSWFSNASFNLSLPFSAASLLYVSRTCPSPSFTFRTFALILSPTDTTVVRSTFASLVYSFLVMIPSAL